MELGRNTGMSGKHAAGFGETTAVDLWTISGLTGLTGLTNRWAAISSSPTTSTPPFTLAFIA